jgi:phosphate starvation-inducible protein PhoH and related proteins
MLLTRIGDNSKMVVTGDLSQADRGNNNGLRDFIELFEQKQNTSSNIDFVRFFNQDIERHPVVREVLDIYGI